MPRIAPPANASTALATRDRLYRANGLEPSGLARDTVPTLGQPTTTTPEPEPQAPERPIYPEHDRREMLMRRLDALEPRPQHECWGR